MHSLISGIEKGKLVKILHSKCYSTYCKRSIPLLYDRDLGELNSAIHAAWAAHSNEREIVKKLATRIAK